MIDKKNVILAGIETGYFRAKDPEKRDLLAVDIAAMPDFEEQEAALIASILKDESDRRSAVYQTKLKRKVHKDEIDANKPLTGGVDTADAHILPYGPGTYVLTTAQNNTDVDPQFFEALLTYCGVNEARLLIARTTYNKNGFLQPGELPEDLYYAPELAGYLVNGQISLGGQIQFIADANVLPTAKNPLSGFAAITPAGISAVIPASKIALQCLAAPKGRNGKILFGTGAVTKRNYIQRKAGAVASSEHNIGALVVIVADDGSFTARQLERMDGEPGFYDEKAYYVAGYEGDACDHTSPAVLQFGDIHAEKMEDRNLARMLELIQHYAPENVMLHDVMDFSSRNHHNVKDPTFMFKQHSAGNSVENDVQLVSQVIDSIAESMLPFGRVHIIESNHDLAINTWLKNADFKDDPQNAILYLSCMLQWYEHIQTGSEAPFNMLRYVYQRFGGGTFEPNFHETDESVIIAGVEHGIHGHSGVNGAKGSPVSFRGLGIPMNTGHTHTPSIHGNVYTAGVTGSLEMGYNIGPSSWKLANILTWPNGQRQIIFM